MFKSLFHIIGLIILSLSFSACSLLPKEIDRTKDWSASKFYTEAKAALNSSDYETAIQYFESLEARYPFGNYAQQAQLEIAYAYYQFDEPDSAITAANRFIKLHPRHKHVDYAYYLKGLANFDRGQSLVDRFLPRDPTKRDPGSARQAFFDFSKLIKKFPNSIYAKDSLQRITYLRNNLAYYELHVAEYYMQRGAYIAAANRAQYIIKHFQGATAMPEALAMMTKAYEKLQLPKLANDTRLVYNKNYPNLDALPTEANNASFIERLLLRKRNKNK